MLTWKKFFGQVLITKQISHQFDELLKFLSSKYPISPFCKQTAKTEKLTVYKFGVSTRCLQCWIQIVNGSVRVQSPNLALFTTNLPRVFVPFCFSAFKRVLKQYNCLDYICLLLCILRLNVLWAERKTKCYQQGTSPVTKI